MNEDLLKRLVFCHSTPGEEDEVIALLAEQWGQAGWHGRALGRYAYLAEQAVEPAAVQGRILLCAHADSPGFIIDSLHDGVATAVSIGYPHFDSKRVRAVVKTSERKIPIYLEAVSEEGRIESFYRFKASTGMRRGDRIAYAPSFKEKKGAFLEAPFLDNRAGCFLLCELLNSLPQATPCQIIVAATAAEEFTGFGASVLAHQLSADLVLCLDATYTSKKQGVELQKGPVLTLSDKSILIPGKVRDFLQKRCQSWDIPLQTEVYNYSGTDARAFPSAGNLALVLPLLIPSDGNHSPREVIARSDLQHTLMLLQHLCTDPE
ncbi:MAG: hypothetical protein WCT05_09635, partial [Lentisphaeria bacterium]